MEWNDWSTWILRWTNLGLQILQVEMVFDNSIKIAMTDARRLGRVECGTSQSVECFTLKQIKLTRLRNPASSERFSELIRKRGTTLKALLLNQQMVYCGIGNCMLYHHSLCPLLTPTIQSIIQGYGRHMLWSKDSSSYKVFESEWDTNCKFT